MKIAIAQINPTIGAFKHNAQKIIAQAEKARERGCELVIFSELAIPGYPPRDLLDKPQFIKAGQACLERLVAEIGDHARKAGLFVVGGEENGKRVHLGWIGLCCHFDYLSCQDVSPKSMPRQRTWFQRLHDDGVGGAGIGAQATAPARFWIKGDARPGLAADVYRRAIVVECLKMATLDTGATQITALRIMGGDIVAPGPDALAAQLLGGSEGIAIARAAVADGVEGARAPLTVGGVHQALAVCPAKQLDSLLAGQFAAIAPVERGADGSVIFWAADKTADSRPQPPAGPHRQGDLAGLGERLAAADFELEIAANSFPLFDELVEYEAATEKAELGVGQVGVVAVEADLAREMAAFEAAGKKPIGLRPMAQTAFDFIDDE